MNELIYLILFLTPLAYYPLFPTEEFETPKTIILTTFTCLTFLLVPFSFLKKEKIAKGLGLFLLSMLISTLTSIEPYVSFFGCPLHPNGLFIWVSYLCFYLLARKHLNTTDKVLNAYKCLSFTSAIVAIYAIFQATGHDFKNWFDVTMDHDFFRPQSTLGHPNAMAAFLACTLPFTIHLSTLKPDFKRLYLPTYLYKGIILLCVSAIIFSASRGMWWAAILSQAWVYRKSMTRVRFKPLLKKASIVGAITLVTIASSSNLRRILPERIKLMHSVGTPRIEYLKAAFRIFKKYPILGAGTDNFRLAFERTRTKKYWSIEYNMAPHRAHNEYLNVLATQGIIGFIAICIFIGAILITMKNSTNLVFYIPSVASLIAFAVQEISSFHCIATMLTLIIALVSLQFNPKESL